MTIEQLEKPDKKPEEYDFFESIENFKERHLDYMATAIVASEYPSEAAVTMTAEAYNALVLSVTPFLSTNFFSSHGESATDKGVSVFMDKTRELTEFKNKISPMKTVIREDESFRQYAVGILLSEVADQEEIDENGGLSKPDQMSIRIYNDYIEPASEVLERISSNPTIQAIIQNKAKKVALREESIMFSRDVAKLAIGVSAGVALGLKFSGILKK